MVEADLRRFVFGLSKAFGVCRSANVFFVWSGWVKGFWLGKVFGRRKFFIWWQKFYFGHLFPALLLNWLLNVINNLQPNNLVAKRVILVAKSCQKLAPAFLVARHNYLHH